MAPDEYVSFSGKNNGGLQLGVNTGTIRDIVFNHTEANDKCLNDLRLTNPRDDKERIKATKGGLLDGSYKWILDHSDFKRWYNEDESRLLWIKGNPGKGKTMLLIGIVEELEQRLAQLRQEKQSRSPTLTYFFCQGTDSKLNNATAVLRGLVYLLAIQQPSLASNLRKEYEHSSGKLFTDPNAFFALCRILVDMLQDYTLPNVYIIIDALDECETGLEQLLNLVAENTSSPRVKWIVSSRNRPDIERQLKFDHSQTKLSLELKANAEYVSNAVGNFIDERVSQLVLLQDDDEVRDQVQSVLRQKAAGTFLWAALVIQELQRVEIWDVLDVLEEIPTGLEKLYARMMEQIGNLKRGNLELCWLVLSTATLAYRPLHIVELGTLSGLPEKISGKVERVRGFVSMCGSFLTIRDDHVYIIHQSAKEYLMGDMASAAIFSMTGGIAETHRDISIRSLQAMMKTLRRDIYTLSRPGFCIDDLDVPISDPLASVRYSCLHWVDHLCEAPHTDGPTKSGLAQTFLESYLLYWAEASSLLGAISEAILAMAKLGRLLKRISSDSRLLALAVDSHRFLTRNSLVIKNFPLQTYVSALVFSPAHSLARQLFRKEEPPWAVATTDKNWGALVQTIESDTYLRRAVVFSPDDKTIVSPSGFYDRTFELWDTVTGEVKHTLKAQNGGRGTDAVEFLPDGRLIVAESIDTTIRIRDALTGEVNHTLEGQSPSKEMISTIAFSRHGKLLASGYFDGIVEIWDLATGELKQKLKGQSSCVMLLLFLPNGGLISLGSNQILEMWDVITGEAKQTIKGRTKTIESFTFSPNGELLVLGLDEGTIELWDATIGETKHTFRGQNEGILSVAVSPDGNTIASGSVNGTLQIWDAATREVRSTLNGHVRAITSVAFSSDSRLIVSNSLDRTIKVWDTTTSQAYNALKPDGKRTASITFSPNGKLIASWLRDKKSIKILDAATGEIKDTLKATRDFHDVFFDTLGLYLFNEETPFQFIGYNHMDTTEKMKLGSWGDGKCGFSLDHGNSWITWHGQKVLWLPHEFRTLGDLTHVAWNSRTTSNVVKLAISYGAGRLMVISLSKPPGPSSIHGS